MQIHTRIHTYIRIHAYTHIHTHTHIRTNEHTHIHTYTHTPFSSPASYDVYHVLLTVTGRPHTYRMRRLQSYFVPDSLFVFFQSAREQDPGSCSAGPVPVYRGVGHQAICRRRSRRPTGMTHSLAPSPPRSLARSLARSLTHSNSLPHSLTLTPSLPPSLPIITPSIHSLPPSSALPSISYISMGCCSPRPTTSTRTATRHHFHPFWTFSHRFNPLYATSHTSCDMLYMRIGC